MIVELARPKVNLTLEVTGRREDGYHLLQSLVVFPEGGDQLEISASDDLILRVDGPFGGGVPADVNNLVLKVAMYLRDKYNVPEGAALKLKKNLPIASGIGGGSADAAAALRGLNRFWNLGLSDRELEKIGLQFGADIPVCVRSLACFMEGIGDQLSLPVQVPGMTILLINPGVSVSTPSIFSELNYPMGSQKGGAELPENFSNIREFLGYASGHCNDLQPPAIFLVPEIADVLDSFSEIETCLFYRMSGSGATCFGLFRCLEEASAAAATISSKHPDWWVFTASLKGGR